MSRPMNIGEAAAAAGVSAKMVRHYEQLGLLPAAARSDAGYRQYGPHEVSLLRFIRQARRLGFSMEQITSLLGLWRDDRRASREVKALAQQHLDLLEQKMRELAQMQQALQALVRACHGNDDPHCAILDNLAAGSAAQAGTPAQAAPRQRASRVPAPPPAQHGPVGSHADLMAWTRLGHAGPPSTG